MRIRTKLFLNAIVVLLCLGVVGFIGFLFANNVARISVSLVETKAMPILKIAKIEKSALEIWLRLIAHNSMMDYDAMVQLEEEISQWKSKLSEEIDAFEKISGFSKEREHQEEDTIAGNWLAFRGKWAQFEQIGQQILAFSQDFTKESAQELIVGDAKLAYHEAISSLHEALNTYSDQMNGLHNDVLVARDSAVLFTSVITLTVGLGVLALLLWVAHSIAKPLRGALNTARQIAAGNLTARARIHNTKDEIGLLLAAMNEMAVNLQNTIQEVSDVFGGFAQGNMSARIKTEFIGDYAEIKRAANDMAEKLQMVISETNRTLKELSGGAMEIEIQAEFMGDFMEIKNALEATAAQLGEATAKNTREAWLKSGQAQLNEQTSGEQNTKKLAEKIINFLTPYVGAHVGAFYLAEEKEEQALKMFASHAYLWRKSADNAFKLGEGIVGQAGFEQKMFLITEPPEDYIHIQSGLGESTPGMILVIPFLYENALKGVIELASFKAFTEIQLEFIKQAMPAVGIAVNTAESRTKMQGLLEQSQAQSEELQIQQEKMQQTNEALQKQSQEMQEQQEKLRQNNEELQSQQEEMQSQQEELRQTNEELEMRTRDLEKERAGIRTKNQELEKTRQAIQIKAEELELASKYKSEFLANMSHELRTPLNSLLILAQLLAENKEENLTGQQVECAQTIHSAGSDLLTLINEILDLSKVEAGKITINPEDIFIADLTESLAQKFQPVAKNKSVDFNINVAENLPQTLHTDDQRLKQVINNLLSNAFKFTAKGSVTLNIARPAANEDLSRSGLDAAASVAVSVADTGIGIPADKQKVIFEAFQQADGTTSRRFGGTGLGLSISRQLVQLMGGEIKLHSEKGKGSRFTAYFPERLKPQTDSGKPASGPLRTTPVQRRESAPARAPEPSAPAETEKMFEDDRTDLKQGDKSLLIIEDDRKFSSILAQLAREKKFKCLLAEDGRSGLQLAKEHSPNAIILDIGLPQVDGWTVMEKLKENPNTRHIPVHFVSGSDHHLEAGKMGAIGYSMKPVSMAELGESFKKIERFISKLIKNLLIITDDEQHRQDILKTVENEQIAITLAGDREEAWRQLGAREYECIILDINLERNAGIEFLDRLQTEEPLSRIPVVVYAERDLTQQEEAALLHCASRITVKTVRSPERLLDEASLFLHEVEAKLPKEQQQMLHIAHDKEAILAGKKVLVADDDIRNSFAMGAVLGKKNMEVVLAANGKEALSALDEQPDIALVLMDIMMPEMDGYEAMRRIRAQARFRNLPVIALTAKAMKEDRTKCIDAGANDYLAKPVDADKLASLMRVWLYQ
ncbi:MAG: response regulator [Gammaproteobacteria bacterium]|nr:response regulator [Gammaproteobacteria bacterium]